MRRNKAISRNEHTRSPIPLLRRKGLGERGVFLASKGYSSTWIYWKNRHADSKTTAR